MKDLCSDGAHGDSVFNLHGQLVRLMSLPEEKQESGKFAYDTSRVEPAVFEK